MMSSQVGRKPFWLNKAFVRCGFTITKMRLLVSTGDKIAHDMVHEVLFTDIQREVDGKLTKVGRLELHFNRSGISDTIWVVLTKSLFLLSLSIGAIVVTALIANRYLIARPLLALTQAIHATQRSGQKHLVDVKAQDEIAHVSEKFNEMQNQLESESFRIKQAYQRLTDLHNQTPALLYSLDEYGIIHAVSDFWLAETGYREDEVVGQAFSEFVPEDFREIYREKQHPLSFSIAEFQEVTCAFRKKDGTIIDILIRESVNSDSLTGQEMSLAVMTDITSLKRAEERLRTQAETDSLTGLLNRYGVSQAIERSIEQARDDRSCVGLIFLDMDRFKWVNDNLGHGAGDELLQLVAKRITALTLEGEYVGRFGGDEFAVIVQGKDASERVVVLAEKINETLAEPTRIRGHDFNVAVSIGISAFPNHATTTTELIKAADVAMYHRKNCGRDGYTVYSQELGQHAGKFLETEQLINQALANDWFELHLQPIIDIEKDRMTGLEALLRLRHPEKGLIGPQAIIETAEKSTQILEIGERVIDLAIQHLVTFRNVPLLRDCYLTVNFSAAQFLPGLPAKLAAKLMRHNVPPEKLVLEITETVLMQEIEHLEKIFDAIRALGCRFALDDFGTGFSSLSYLNKFPVSLLKIDRSFLQTMAGADQHPHRAAKTQTLMQGIVAMSHELELDVVIEGVETEADCKRVESLGADMAQGYYFSKPLPISQFIADANKAGHSLTG